MSPSNGPAMICATSAMRPGPTRVGRLGLGITLPRTVALPTLLTAGGGAILGVLAALIIAPGISSVMYAAIFGGVAGWFLVTFSPMQGESLIKWAMLKTNTARRVRRVNGERVMLAVGVAPVSQPPRGQVHLQRSAVRVPSDQYDDRGVLISDVNRNIPADAGASLRASATTTSSLKSMTAAGGHSLSRRTRRRKHAADTEA